MKKEEALRILRDRGQEQLLRFYDELSPSERDNLIGQIERIDWETVALFDHPEDLTGKGRIAPLKGLDVGEIAQREAEFLSVGKAAIGAGKVGAVLLAGGQGTRLGSDAPKGTFNVGITRTVSIFERLMCNLKESNSVCDATVPLYIMTSEKNDRETRAFFEQNAYFGYPASEVKFFVQETAPCVGTDGKILLEEKGKIASSPNGNGGWYASLLQAGLGEDLDKRGVEWLNVFAVDNVLQRIADPVFVGATIAEGVNCGAKVVRKTCPEERVGVLCLEDGAPNIIEYYEIPKETAAARDERGELLYPYGVILNYLFRVSRLKEMEKARIPVHVVKKKIPCLDEAGNPIMPQTENGYKFETLILDMVRLMGNCLPYEVVREREFAPIKNKTGTDSVESARELLARNGVEL
ncbi:MAG: UTP--glucose-1-phosphate uridylyltransferase [Candidatus Gallimonas sp.]